VAADLGRLAKPGAPFCGKSSKTLSSSGIKRAQLSPCAGTDAELHRIVAFLTLSCCNSPTHLNQLHDYYG